MDFFTAVTQQLGSKAQLTNDKNTDHLVYCDKKVADCRSYFPGERSRRTALSHNNEFPILQVSSTQAYLEKSLGP